MRFVQMADSIGKMARSIERMSDKLADQTLLMERSNQHSTQIDNLDKRVDVIEQRRPMWDLVVKGAGIGAIVILTSLLGAIVSVVVI